MLVFNFMFAIDITHDNRNTATKLFETLQSSVKLFLPQLLRFKCPTQLSIRGILRKSFQIMSIIYWIHMNLMCCIIIFLTLIKSTIMQLWWFIQASRYLTVLNQYLLLIISQTGIQVGFCFNYMYFTINDFNFLLNFLLVCFRFFLVSSDLNLSVLLR